MTQWIDFKLLKAQLSFETVLVHYGMKTTKDGEAHVKSACPFHDDKRPSLGVDLKRKIWQCFACKLSGNVLDFVTRMEGLDPSDAGAIRKGAETAIDIMSIDLEAHANARPEGTRRARRQKIEQPKPVASSLPPAEAPIDDGPDNAPLSFELKLERSHTFLKSKGFKKSTYEAFGVGFAKRGMMKGRVCFPLWNSEAELIGYAGRAVSNENTDDAPLWLYPPKFNPTRFLFNWYRFAGDPPEHVVLAGNYWDVLTSYEHGVPAICVPAFELESSHASMLKCAGVTQVSLLVGDDAERNAISQALMQLAPHVFVSVRSFDELIEMSAATQPT